MCRKFQKNAKTIEEFTGKKRQEGDFQPMEWPIDGNPEAEL